MTREEARQLIEDTESDYKNYKFRILRGLQILAKYDSKLDSHIGFEHDVMYVGEFSEEMTEEEVREMALCGWLLSEEFDDCWTHF